MGGGAGRLRRLDDCPEPCPTEMRLITWAEVQRRTSVKRRTAERLIAAGHFPPPRKIPGSIRVAWVESEIQAWVRARVASLD